MRTVKFNCHSNSAPAYGCNKPGDNSGEYVRIGDYKQKEAYLVYEWDECCGENAELYRQVERLRHNLGEVAAERDKLQAAIERSEETVVNCCICGLECMTPKDLGIGTCEACVKKAGEIADEQTDSCFYSYMDEDQ